MTTPPRLEGTEATPPPLARPIPPPPPPRSVTGAPPPPPHLKLNRQNCFQKKKKGNTVEGKRQSRLGSVAKVTTILSFYLSLSSGSTSPAFAGGALPSVPKNNALGHFGVQTYIFYPFLAKMPIRSWPLFSRSYRPPLRMRRQMRKMTLASSSSSAAAPSPPRPCSSSPLAADALSWDSSLLYIFLSIIPGKLRGDGVCHRLCNLFS